MAQSPEEFVVPEEMKEWVGREIQLGTAVVEAGAIRRFADAIKDPNPIYRDDEYAGKTSYESIIAPPTFIHSLRNVGYVMIPPESMPWEKSTGLNGGNEFEFFKPFRPGDVITGTAKMVDIRSRQSRNLGPMLFFIVEMTYTNQKREVVAKQRSTTIRYEAKG